MGRLLFLVLFAIFSIAQPATAERPADSLQTEIQRMRAAQSYDMSEESLRNGFPSLEFLESGGALLAYMPANSKVVNKRRADLPPSHPLYFVDGFEEDDLLLVETSLTHSARFYIVFSTGPSADPSFYFIRIGSTPAGPWAELSGNALAVPANGSLYVASRYNNYFTKREKFVYSPDGLREVHQPYYFVGLNTKTLRPLTLHASPSTESPVVHLPSGSRIQVLLTDDREDDQKRTCFLVKSPFGLLGWVCVPSTQYYSDVIEGISWWGD